LLDRLLRDLGAVVLYKLLHGVELLDRLLRDLGAVVLYKLLHGVTGLLTRLVV
jgi:hypothetical protein